MSNYRYNLYLFGVLWREPKIQLLDRNQKVVKSIGGKWRWTPASKCWFPRTAVGVAVRDALRSVGL